MADIQFRNESDGQSFQMTHPKAARVLDDIEKWAGSNGFEHITFWRDESDSTKYWVQLGEDKLNYWVHESTFSEGKHEEVEMQLDYARGAQRRSAAGYAKFDK
ncbi:hypothetical protein EHF33_12050 [Deinococcus psychrotolerans]|uniref:Uncharacterized protein n=2 Tax=Deinococcus TaxID=1298 RepID=A0A553UMF3_9DEIO|nr:MULTISPECIES: hypothetical protein [Deinococcus]AZI43386.1 hypothetical protein EHF33_12050 [Deinococcus psychrotolerans]TSA81374.1 hypothetical protein FNU79_15315 [Deinococcus detaillensis]